MRDAQFQLLGFGFSFVSCVFLFMLYTTITIASFEVTMPLARMSPPHRQTYNSPHPNTKATSELGNRTTLWRLKNYQNLFSSLHAKKSSKYKNFEDFLLQSSEQSTDSDFDNNHILVTFSSPFCGPCHKLRDELIIVKKTLQDNVTLVNIDSNKYPSLSCRYNITDLPCTLIFRRGKEEHRIQGIVTANEIIEHIRLLTNKKSHVTKNDT